MIVDNFLAIVAGCALGIAVSAHVLFVKLSRRMSRCEDTCDYLCSREITRLLGPVIGANYGHTDAHGQRTGAPRTPTGS